MRPGPTRVLRPNCRQSRLLTTGQALHLRANAANTQHLGQASHDSPRRVQNLSPPKVPTMVPPPTGEATRCHRLPEPAAIWRVAQPEGEQAVLSHADGLLLACPAPPLAGIALGLGTAEAC